MAALQSSLTKLPSNSFISVNNFVKMPPRLSKRQQRQQEELNLAAGDDNEASSAEESLAVRPAVSAFAAVRPIETHRNID